MFEKMAKALRGLIASTYIPVDCRDTLLEMAKEIDTLRREVDQLKEEKQ